MRVERYDAERHLEIIQGWHNRRGVAPYPWECLPKFGLVVYDDARPMACVFIRSCEGQVAMMDHVLANDELPPGGARDAIDLIFDHAEQIVGTEMGAKLFITWSSRDSMLRRSRERGFALIPTTVIVGRL